MTGFTILVIYFVLNFAIIHFYATKYVNYDEEKIETQDLYTEALMLSFCVFMVSWIMTHTFCEPKLVTIT